MEFYRDDPGAGAHQMMSQRTVPRTEVEHELARAYVRVIDDARGPYAKDPACGPQAGPTA